MTKKQVNKLKTLYKQVVEKNITDESTLELFEKAIELAEFEKPFVDTSAIYLDGVHDGKKIMYGTINYVLRECHEENKKLFTGEIYSMISTKLENHKNTKSIH